MYIHGLGISIGEIAESIPTVDREVPVYRVGKIFNENAQSGIVVVENQVPVGLIMKNKLYYHLASRYGVSLYENRPVALIMDKLPLVVNRDMPLEEVSYLAMSRSEQNLYDDIIVVDNGKYAGVVSVMSLLNNITKIQLCCAHNSNPLTGLHGNLVIEANLKQLVENNKPFTVFYIDLDNFKAFNDKYGFERGDKALLLTAQILSDSLAYADCQDCFLGHIGGDDFLIIARPEVDKVISKYIIENFDRDIRKLYDSGDLVRGFIEISNRRGQIEHFPIMTISLAAVTNISLKFNNYLEIGEIAAELKKIAKQNEGSSVVFDRRHSEISKGVSRD